MSGASSQPVRSRGLPSMWSSQPSGPSSLKPMYCTYTNTVSASATVTLRLEVGECMNGIMPNRFMARM